MLPTGHERDGPARPRHAGRPTPGAARAAPSVVVVEDDSALRELMVDDLNARGMLAAGAGSGAGAERLLAGAPADAVIVDLGLPDQDGIGLVGRLRSRQPALGILVVTGRTRVEERILAYEAGADVYLTKPVDYRELAAAIRATLRDRAPPAPGASPPERPEIAWRLDLSSWRLAAPSGASVKLTHTELRVLACLGEHPGQPVERERIAAQLGSDPIRSGHRHVDQIVSRLRRKIERELGWQPPIASAHGQGYLVVGTLVRTEGDTPHGA